MTRVTLSDFSGEQRNSLTNMHTYPFKSREFTVYSVLSANRDFFFGVHYVACTALCVCYFEDDVVLATSEPERRG